MANVRLPMLIDVPRAVAYKAWLAPADYPRFMEDLASVAMSNRDRWSWRPRTGEGEPFEARMVEREHDSVIAWESADGPWRRLTVTFASLSGPSTWLICSMDVPVEDSPEAVQKLHDLSVMIRSWLERFRVWSEGTWRREANGACSGI